jgi:tetratricopeptide (TPR) repeat protein
MAHLEPEGFLLLADYATEPGSLTGAESVAQHYGGSMAHAIDFGQVDRWSHTLRGWQAFAPTAPSESIQVRLVCGQLRSAAIAPFLICFDGGRWDLPSRLVRLSAQSRDNPRHEAARDLLLRALEARPRNWHTLERVASFLLRTDRDPEAALVATLAGLELHPLHPGLWNLRGDAHYERRERAEAEAAFRRAIEIDPRDIRGRLNLSYVLADTHRYPEALAVLGEALGLDTAVEQREALLARQQRILQQMSDRERERLLQLVNRVREWLPGDDDPP